MMFDVALPSTNNLSQQNAFKLLRALNKSESRAKTYRFIIYTRKSVDDHLGNKTLIDQEQICREFATKHGYEIVRVYAEVASGASNDREQFENAISTLLDKKEGVDGIIVAKCDRLGRDARRLADLIPKIVKSGRNVISVLDTSYRYGPLFPGNTPDGVDFILKNLFSECERAQHRQRTLAAMEQRRKRRHGISRWSPYGYHFKVISRDGSVRTSYESATLKDRTKDSILLIEEDEDEQKQIQSLIELVLKKHENNEKVSGGEMLAHLKFNNLDRHYRKSVEGMTAKITDTSNLFRSFHNYLKYVQILHGQDYLEENSASTT